MMLAMEYFLKTDKKRKEYLIIQFFVSLTIIASISFYNFDMNNLFIVLSIGLIYIFFFMGSMTSQGGFSKKRNQLLLLPTKRTRIYDSIYAIDLLSMMSLVILSLIISILVNLIINRSLAFPRIGGLYLIFLNVVFLLIIEPAFIVTEFASENTHIYLFGAILTILFIYPKLLGALTSDIVFPELLDRAEIAYMKRDFLKKIGMIIFTYFLGKFIFIRKDLVN